MNEETEYTDAVMPTDTVSWTDATDTSVQVAVLDKNGQIVMRTIQLDRIKPVSTASAHAVLASINESLIKLYGPQVSNKYLIGSYLTGTGVYHHIPRSDSPNELRSPSISLAALRRLLAQIEDFSGKRIGVRPNPEYLSIYITGSLSGTEAVQEVRVLHRSLSRESAYSLWYDGDMEIVLRGLSLLNLKFTQDWILVPLTVNGKVVHQYRVGDIINNVLRITGLEQLVPIRAAMTGRNQFFQAISESSVFALDWAGLDQSLTNTLKDPSENITAFQEFIRDKASQGAVYPVVTNSNKNQSLEDLMSDHGYPGNVEKITSAIFKEELIDGKVIDAVQDMDSKESKLLNKALRVIKEEDPTAYTRILLRSNYRTLEANVDAYMTKRELTKSGAKKTTQKVID